MNLPGGRPMPFYASTCFDPNWRVVGVYIYINTFTPCRIWNLMDLGGVHLLVISPSKNGGWKTTFLLGREHFRSTFWPLLGPRNVLPWWGKPSLFFWYDCWGHLDGDPTMICQQKLQLVDIP